MNKIGNIFRLLSLVFVGLLVWGVATFPNYVQAAKKCEGGCGGQQWCKNGKCVYNNEKNPKPKEYECNSTTCACADPGCHCEGNRCVNNPKPTDQPKEDCRARQCPDGGKWDSKACICLEPTPTRVYICNTDNCPSPNYECESEHKCVRINTTPDPTKPLTPIKKTCTVGVFCYTDQTNRSGFGHYDAQCDCKANALDPTAYCKANIQCGGGCDPTKEGGLCKSYCNTTNTNSCGAKCIRDSMGGRCPAEGTYCEDVKAACSKRGGTYYPVTNCYCLSPTKSCDAVKPDSVKSCKDKGGTLNEACECTNIPTQTPKPTSATLSLTPTITQIPTLSGSPTGTITIQPTATVEPTHTGCTDSCDDDCFYEFPINKRHCRITCSNGDVIKTWKQPCNSSYNPSAKDASSAITTKDLTASSAVKSTTVCSSDQMNSCYDHFGNLDSKCDCVGEWKCTRADKARCDEKGQVVNENTCGCVNKTATVSFRETAVTAQTTKRVSLEKKCENKGGINSGDLVSCIAPGNVMGRQVKFCCANDSKTCSNSPCYPQGMSFAVVKSSL